LTRFTTRANLPAVALYNTIGIGYDTTRRADPYIASRLLALLDPQPGARYLDLACGTGNYTTAIAAAGVRIYGIDVSPVMLAAARVKSGIAGWALGAAESLPFCDGAFAGAICTLAIHHFTDLRRAFTDVARVVAHGRLVILTADPEQMKRYWLREYFPILMADAIAQMPDLPQVADTLRAAGFETIRTEIYEVRPDLDDLFIYAGKQRPQLYLDPRIRAGISNFARLENQTEVEAGCARLADDIASGRIDDIIESYRHDGGDYLFVIATKE
jgi:SAM-dependent methyltransferase